MSINKDKRWNQSSPNKKRQTADLNKENNIIPNFVQQISSIKKDTQNRLYTIHSDFYFSTEQTRRINENILEKISIKKYIPPTSIKQCICPQGYYSGQLTCEGKINGVGSMFFKPGSFYYGQWQDFKPYGFGIFVFETGGYIMGQFKNGLVDGIAQVFYSNGDQYQGQWSRGNYHGFGRKIKTNGEVTPVINNEGNKVANKCQDFVQDTSLEFLKQGYFQNALQQHLPNIYVHKDRTVYGLPCDLSGLGCILYKSGRVEMGFFKNCSLEGRGRVIFASGDIYDGFLLDGQLQGVGQYYNYQKQTLVTGIFGQNKIVVIKGQSKQYPPPQLEGGEIDEQASMMKESSFIINQADIIIDPSVPVDYRIIGRNLYSKIRCQNKQNIVQIEESKSNKQYVQPLSCTNILQKRFKFTKPTSSSKVDQIQSLIGQILQEPSQRLSKAETLISYTAETPQQSNPPRFEEYASRNQSRVSKLNCVSTQDINQFKQHFLSSDKKQFCRQRTQSLQRYQHIVIQFENRFTKGYQSQNEQIRNLRC